VRSVRITLIVGLGLLAASVAVVLAHRSTRLAGSDNTPATALVEELPARGGRLCQGGEILPQGTAALRLSLQSDAGPPIDVLALAGARRVAAGHRAAGWSGSSVTVPLAASVRRDVPVRVCVRVGAGGGEHVDVLGLAASESAPGRLRVEDLRAGRASWWSFAPQIVARLGRGHAWSGPSVALVAGLLTLAAIGVALHRLARVPPAAWICALVALLNAAAWSLLTPPFQIPDEPAQYAYAEHVAQTGRPPAEAPFSLRVGFSPEEALVVSDLRSDEVAGHPENSGPWLALDQRQLERDLHAHASRHGDGYSYGATPQPPLYYALAAVPYRLANGATLLQRLELMRLLSALLGALTVLFTFLFLREALPRVPWAWTVGGLAAALQPVFATSTSGVNPDALLFTASAALFWCLARAFRHGLDRRLAVATGGVIAVGLLAKLNVVGLLPGAVLALVLVALRDERARRRRRPRLAALGLPALALALAAVPVLVVTVLNTAAWHRPALGLVGGQGNVLFGNGTLVHHLAYLWETFLPGLPGMEHVFHHDMTLVHFDELVGAFGGREVRFPTWVNRAALVPAALVALLAAQGLRRAGDAVRRRRAELLCYGAMVAGLALMVTAQYYALEARFHSVGEYHQVRYFFPLLPLYGALLALAARGAGRRVYTAGTAIVVLAVAHDVWSQLLVIGRFYA
jgi:predicted membrane protein DUF2142